MHWVVGFSKNLLHLCWVWMEPLQQEFCFVHFPREGSQVELGASGGSRLGAVMFPHRQSYDIFLGTVLPTSGQATLSKDEDVCRGRAGFVLVPIGVIPSRPEGCGLKEPAVKGG